MILMMCARQRPLMVFFAPPQVWDAESGKENCTLRGHSGEVSDCRFLSSNVIASTARDGTVKLWDIQRGKCITTFYGLPMCTVAVSPDSQLLAAGDSAGGVYILQAPKAKLEAKRC